MSRFRPSTFLPIILVSACSGSESQDVLARPGSSSSGAISGDCAPEVEPNDNPKEANVLAPALCGTLSQKDGKEFLSFELQPTTSSMSINFSGQVRLRVEVQGVKTELTPSSAGQVPFVMGSPYSIEVTALPGENDVAWRVAIIEK